MYLHFVFVLHQEHISCGQDAPHQLPQLRRKYNVHVSIFKDLGRRNWFLINKNANFMKLLGPYIHIM